jgi:hypothetical protein
MSALALAFAQAGAASTFLHVTTADMVAGADAVVEGRVIALRSFWIDSGYIVTEATVRVDEVVIGTAPRYVTVRTFGGEVGDFTIVAHGFPQFQTDQAVLLFLKKEPADGSVRVLGYQAGHYQIVEREDGTALAVPTVDAGARFITADGRSAPPLETIELTRFKQRLHRIAEQLGRRDVRK